MTYFHKWSSLLKDGQAEYSLLLCLDMCKTLANVVSDDRLFYATEEWHLVCVASDVHEFLIRKMTFLKQYNNGEYVIVEGDRLRALDIIIRMNRLVFSLAVRAFHKSCLIIRD